MHHKPHKQHSVACLCRVVISDRASHRNLHPCNTETEARHPVEVAKERTER